MEDKAPQAHQSKTEVEGLAEGSGEDATRPEAACGPRERSGQGKKAQKGNRDSEKAGLVARVKNTKTAKKPEGKGKPPQAGNPFYHVERSRSQVMCRTGCGGAGSTYRVQYGPGHDHKTEKAAVAAAAAWVAQQRGKR